MPTGVVAVSHNKGKLDGSLAFERFHLQTENRKVGPTGVIVGFL